MELTKTYDQIVADLHRKWAGYVYQEEKTKISWLGTSQKALRARSDLIDLIGSVRERSESIQLITVSITRGQRNRRPYFHAILQRDGFRINYTWQSEVQRGGTRVMCWTPDRDAETQKVYDSYIDHLVKKTS